MTTKESPVPNARSRADTKSPTPVSNSTKPATSLGPAASFLVRYRPPGPIAALVARLALAVDAAVIASITLQYGAPAGVIRHALAGREEGTLAAALDLIEGAVRWA
jgi:hypothetical protein